jgi:hypothetical protein
MYVLGPTQCEKTTFMANLASSQPRREPRVLPTRSGRPSTSRQGRFSGWGSVASQNPYLDPRQAWLAPRQHEGGARARLGGPAVSSTNRRAGLQRKQRGGEGSCPATLRTQGSAPKRSSSNPGRPSPPLQRLKAEKNNFVDPRHQSTKAPAAMRRAADFFSFPQTRGWNLPAQSFRPRSATTPSTWTSSRPRLDP